MDLKATLGESYKEGMTFEEVTAALATVNLVDPATATANTIPKATFDKTASELAAAKKALATKMTEDELSAQSVKDLQDKYAALEKETTVSKNANQFLELGYEAPLALSAATALANGDHAGVFEAQKRFIAAKEIKLRAEIMNSNPKPPAGLPPVTGMTKEKFQALSYIDQNKFASENPNWKEIIK